MSKWCFNYESGEYEYIDRDGFSIDRGEYVYNWDDSEYNREEDLWNDDDEDDLQKTPRKTTDKVKIMPCKLISELSKKFG